MWHKSIEAGGNRGPLSMFFSYAFFSKDFEIDFLVLSEFGNQNILMD